MSKQKKTEQLGMSVSTANGRLVKDLLFKLAIDAGHKCHRCGDVLTRDTFSIEHKVPWLDSENPLGLYFDLDNIAFSHLSCNSGAARRPTKKYFTPEDKREADRLRSNRSSKKAYTPEKRRERYIVEGR